MENKQPQTAPADVRENIMGTMDINPLLIKLSVPMMISMLVQALYNVVDSTFVVKQDYMFVKDQNMELMVKPFLE